MLEALNYRLQWGPTKRMRFPSYNRFMSCASFIFLMPCGFSMRSYPAQLPTVSVAPAVEIRQVHEVKQGASGWFEVKIEPETNQVPVTLRLRRFAGTGSASFENGTEEFRLAKSGTVQVHGIIASDLPGGLALTAWIDSAEQPAATAFFDVIAASPKPRIFWETFDITGTTQSVVVGQQVLLTVVLHPSLEIRSQNWTIEPEGEYVGGFVHTPTLGGPQPVTVNGETVTFYWVQPGLQRRVTYRVTMNDGETATATAVFDVEGPSLRDMVVPPVEVIVRPGAEPGSSYMSFAGNGISFQAHYNLPEGLMRNYTWVQLVTRDVMHVRVAKEWMVCRPKSEPQAELGVGLDTVYPYDWKNPTGDSPPIQLEPDSEEVARSFHARMYLLWGSGRSNSIVVPLGYVAWYFEGRAIREDLLRNTWTLINGSGGADNPDQPYQPTHTYPSWRTVVPYSGVIECKK